MCCSNCYSFGCWELISCSKLSMVPRQSPKMHLRKKLISPGGKCFWPRRALLTGSSLVASCGLSPSLGSSLFLVWDVRYHSPRSAFTEEDSELVISYMAKQSFCRQAIELTCKLTFISLFWQKPRLLRGFPGIQWFRLHASNVEDVGSIPGQDTNFSHAVWPKRND